MSVEGGLDQGPRGCTQMRKQQGKKKKKSEQGKELDRHAQITAGQPHGWEGRLLCVTLYDTEWKKKGSEEYTENHEDAKPHNGFLTVHSQALTEEIS